MPNVWNAEIKCRTAFPFRAFSRRVDKRVKIRKIVIFGPSQQKNYKSQDDAS